MNDPSDITLRKFTPPPWKLPDCPGTVVCAYSDDGQPGEMLFALRGPAFKSEQYPADLLAEYAEFIVKTLNNYDRLIGVLQAIRTHSDDGRAVMLVADVLDELSAKPLS